MSDKFGLYPLKILYFKRLINRALWLGFILLFLYIPQLNAQPVVLDLEYSTLTFLNSNRSVVEGSGINDFSQGTVHRFDNLISKNGITVYGLMTIVEVNNATILNFDDDTGFGITGRFQPAISVLTDKTGFVTYQLQFFNVATNEDIFLNKYNITGIDIDGDNPLNREFVEFGGYFSYTLNNPSLLEVSSSYFSGRTRFLGRPTSLSGMVFDNSRTCIINFTNPNNLITFTLGQTRQNSIRNYSLQFGSPAGSFSNPKITINPLTVAIDDVGTPVNSNTGGTAVGNILNNDLNNGQLISLSQVYISVIDSPGHSGISLDISKGVVTVAPGTPYGIYTLKYQICMRTNPTEKCASAIIKVIVLAADLSITKSDTPESVIAGQNLTYTITVTNNGPTFADSVTVKDIFPPGLSFVSATPSVGSWNNSTWNIGKMADSAIEKLILVVRVSGNITENIQNSAIIGSSTFDPVPSNNNVLQLTTVLSSANLSISKIDTPDPALAGQNVTYTVNVTNHGPSDALNVQVTDNLPAGLTIKDTDVSKGKWVTPKWTIGTLENGATATFNILAAVNKGFVGKIVNTASVSSKTTDPFLTDNSSTQVTTINASADLSIEKIVDIDTIIAGEVVNFSFLITNNGPANASNVQFEDKIPPEIQFVQFSIDNGLTWNIWGASYNIGSLNVGDSINVLMVGSLEANAVSGSIISNTATISSSTPDPNMLNNSQINVINITTNSDLSVTLTSPSPVVSGTKISYTLSVMNSGPAYSGSLVVTDSLPAAIANAEYSLNNGTSWAAWPGTLNFPTLNYPGNMSILIRGDVSPGASGSITNRAFVASATPDLNKSNNISSGSTTIHGQADLILTIKATTAPVQRNDQINYILSVFNNGPGNATNVVITDSIISGSISNAEYFSGSGWQRWPDSLNVGTLKNDSTISIQIRGNVTASAPDRIENSASVVSRVADPFPLNNKQTIQTVIDEIADLSVVLNGPPTINAGNQIQFTVVVKNKSSNTNAENVVIIDDIDNAKILNSTYSINGGINWNPWTGSKNMGTILFGDSVTIRIKGNVLSNANGILKNTVQINSSTPDEVPANNIATYSKTITILSDISVEKTILTSPDGIVEGSKIDFRIKYKNNGPSDAVNFKITDIPSVMFLNFEVSQYSASFIPWTGTTSVGNVVAGKEGYLYVRGTIPGGTIGPISSLVSVTSTSIDSNLTNNTSQVTTKVNRKADLQITASGLPNPVVAGETFIFTLSVKNDGPSISGGFDISNTIPSGLQNTQFSINQGLSWSSWVEPFQFTGTLPSGNSFDILVKSKVKTDVVNGSLINFLFSVSISTIDPKTNNNSFQGNVTVLTKADLAIEEFVDNNRLSVGDLVKLKLRASNNGPSNATSVLVTDKLPSGFSYVSDNGNGTYSPATGVWNIGNMVYSSSVQLEINARVLAAGNYINSVNISGIDNDTVFLNNVAFVEIVPDIEAIFTVAAPQNVDNYKSGQILVNVTDGDGNVVSALLSTGVLPGGTELDQFSGRVIVADSTLLTGGIYNFELTTTDEKGGMTKIPVLIRINFDSESEYNVALPKNVDDYANGETIATVSDTDGEIVQCSLVSGSIPHGTSLNSATGEITISNSLVLLAGSYSFTVSSVDAQGGKTIQLVTIGISPDSESAYTVYPPRMVEFYNNGDTLAFVTDFDGAIVYTELKGRSLPAGSLLNPITGEIVIVNSELLKSGTYWVRINTNDTDGGKTSQLVMIKIKSGVGPDYSVKQSLNIDSYRIGDTLAYVTSDFEEIVSAEQVSGDLPPGTSLDTLTGAITVADTSLLIAGSFSATIKINSSYSLIVSIVIDPDFESLYTVEPPQNLFNYSNGEILASVSDSNGLVVSAIIQSGNLPNGVGINSGSGEIFVTDITLLEAAIHTFSIKTIDITGGITVQQVTISFVATDLMIEKFCSPNVVIAGERLIYTLIVKNKGPNEAQDVFVTDLLPPELSIVSFTPSAGNWVSPNWSIGTLANGASEMLIIEAYVSSSSTGTITNKATVTSLTSDKVPENNIAILKTPVNTHADLAVALTANPDPVTAGENITYTMTVLNTGPSDAQNVVLINNLPANVNFVSATDGGTINNRQVKWNLTGLHRGNIHVFELVVSVNSNVQGGSIIKNEAGVYSDNSGGTVNSNLVEILVSTHSELTIQKSATSEIVQAGENFTYNIIAANNGPSDAVNVRITDELPSTLTFVSASGNGVYSNGVVTWSPGTLVNGANYTCTLVVAVKSNVTTGTIITNKAIVISNTSGKPIESESENVRVEAHTILEIVKNASGNNIIAGNEFNYSIAITNVGSSDAINVRITDVLPSSLLFVSASGGATYNDGVVTWTPGTLAKGANYLCSLVVKVNSNVAEGTVITNKAIVTSNSIDEPVESEPEAVLVDAQSELKILKTASKNEVLAGEEVTYLINIENSGPSNATNVRITDELASSLTFISASGNATFSNGVVTWLPGDMAKGVKYDCNLVALVKGNITNGTIIPNTAKVNCDASDEPVESVPENILIKTKTELRITKNASDREATAGNEVTYSIEIENAGPSDAINVTVTDTLPDGLTFVGASNGGVYENGIVTWFESRLSGGSIKTYSLTVEVNSNVLDGTVIRNSAFIIDEISGYFVESIPEEIKINSVAELTILKSAVSTVISGEYLVYSLQVTNNGRSDAFNVELTDTLPRGVLFVSAGNGGTVSNGIVIWNLVSLPSGASQIFTLVVGVDDILPDKTQLSNTAWVDFDHADGQVQSNEVTTIVTKFSVTASDDYGLPLVGTDGGTAVENILVNDFFGTTVADVSIVNITMVSASSPLITLDQNIGRVVVASETPAGTYQLVYRICLKNFPNICDEATVHITILTPVIKATYDTGSPLYDTKGGVAVEDVTDNDLLNGMPVNVDDIQISVVAPATVPGIDLNIKTGEVLVEPGVQSGTYNITYRICEILNPENCDEAIISVTILSTDECKFLVPTGFSPNDDGIHDFFMIKCIEKYPDATLEVFNRWGNLVYRKEKYGNIDQWGEADAWWGGYSSRNLNMGKKKLPPGTYFFVLKLNSGEEEPIKGSVFLNR